MGDNKSKKAMNKLGKLFGVSNTNLQNLHQSQQQLEGGDFEESPTGQKGGSGGYHSGEKPSSINEEELILSQLENDLVSPLPNDNAAAAAATAAAPPPPSSAVSNGFSHEGYAHAGHSSSVASFSGGVGVSGRTSSKQQSQNGAFVSSPQSTVASSSSTPTNHNINNNNSNSNNNLSNMQPTVDSPLHSLISSGDDGLVHPQPKPTAISSHYDPAFYQSSVIARSPPVSRSSSTTGPSTKKHNTTSINSTRPGSNPVSRSSSVKTKPKDHVQRSTSPTAAHKPRFRMLDNGLHEHNLRSARRQEKLSNMLKDLLGAKKLRDEAKSAVPNILQSNQPSASAGLTPQSQNKPPTLFAGLVSQVKNNTSPYHGPALGPSEQQDCRSFVEKYGRCQEVIGRGSFGVVRVSHKKLGGGTKAPEEVLYAVKEFKRKPNESEKKYNRRLTSEFCISSSLKHLNIIDTLDLLKDAKGDYCEVMEFCSGGDLYTLIIALGKLEYAEADCFFKQLIKGVNYMHEMGVSHRDLKPENLLLTKNGVLKITDFGNGECFKMAWENEIQLSEGICGSSPYIAPEEFTQQSFDPRGVDIWACGVIYMAMRTGRQLWKLADPKKDEFFEEYLLKRKDASGYDPIESLKRARCRNVIYSILDPKPKRRINGKQILNSEWGREIKLCEAAQGLAEESKTTQSSQTNQINQINQTNQTHQINQINQLNQLNQLNQTNQTNQPVQDQHQ